MPKVIYIRWTEEQEAFIREHVVERKMHPLDVFPLFNQAWPKPERSWNAFRAKVRDMGIAWGDLSPQKHALTDPESIKKRVAEDAALVRLRQKVSELEIKYKELVGEKTLGDRMEAVLRSEVRALPKVNLVWKVPKDRMTKEVAGLLLGDFHLGEKVEREAVCDFGEYDFDIFVRRLKLLAESIKSITIKKLKGYDIRKLCIFGLGDMVSGRIHDELIENAEDIIFQIVNGAYVTAQFILELSKMFEEIEIDGVLGNHGRLTKKRYHKKRYTNWDFVFYQFVATFLAGNDRIKCTFPKSFFIVKQIYNWNFLVMHGDAIKSWMRIPWYGIERAMWKLGDLLQGKGINVQYRVLGHFHNTGELDRTPGETIINGSVVGGSEFSLMSMFEFSRPTQLFFGVHSEIGVTWRYPLRLDLPAIGDVIPYNYNRDLDAGRYMKELLKKNE